MERTDCVEWPRRLWTQFAFWMFLRFRQNGFLSHCVVYLWPSSQKAYQYLTAPCCTRESVWCDSQQGTPLHPKKLKNTPWVVGTGEHRNTGQWLGVKITVLLGCHYFACIVSVCAMSLLCKCKSTVKSTLVFKKLKSLHGCSFFTICNCSIFHWYTNEKSSCTRASCPTLLV